MAVLNIRIDDQIHEQLKELANAQGVSLSEYVRNLVMEAVVPVYEPAAFHGDEPAPTTMPLFERQTLSLLHRILGRVLPEGTNDDDGDVYEQLSRARVIEAGFTGEYWREVAGFRIELSRRDCDLVLDILDMFRAITVSISRLERGGEAIGEDLAFRLEFRGFDGNDSREAHMASYVEHLMSEDRWTELQPQVAKNDNGNSHCRMLDIYMRMLAEHRRIMHSRGKFLSRDDYFLSREELERIAGERVHPSERN